MNIRKEELRKAFKRCWKRHMEYAAIAKELGVGVASLYRWRVELGIPCRARGGERRKKS
jgi:transposase-like protein